ncbi:hypothetical protein ACFLZV_04300 [Candidatus Margulisiibacteriota bacterium]
MMNNNKLEDSEFYQDIIVNKLTALPQEPVPEHLWNKIQSSIKQTANKEETPKGFFASAISSFFTVPLKYAVLAVFIFAAFSLFQYKSYTTYKNVNAFIEEYAVYISSDNSILPDNGDMLGTFF